jgi:hypothetical protein
MSKRPTRVLATLRLEFVPLLSGVSPHVDLEPTTTASSEFARGDERDVERRRLHAVEKGFGLGGHDLRNDQPSVDVLACRHLAHVYVVPIDRQDSLVSANSNLALHGVFLEIPSTGPLDRQCGSAYLVSLLEIAQCAAILLMRSRFGLTLED